MQPMLGVSDRESVVTLLRDLVAIPSVNPGIDPEGEGERAVGDFVLSYAAAHGFATATQEVLGNRRNVLVDLGLPAERTLALVTHLDTVPRRDLSPRALEGCSEDGRVYGRGACDAKGSLAAMLQALHVLRARVDQLRVNVQVAALVDEEHTFQGALAYLAAQRPLPVAAIVGEPTRLDVVVAHKGVLRCRLRVHGRAAHTSQPETGINAVDKMCDVLVALRRAFAGAALPEHPLVGRPALTIAQINGGVAPNVVPEWCEAVLDRRLLPGEHGAEVLAWLDHVLEQAHAADPQLDLARDEPFVLDEALETAVTEPIVQATLSARRAVRGPGEPIGVPFGTDGSKLSVRGGIPTVVLGPGDIAQAHTADEYIDVDALIQASEIYVQSALAL